MAGNAHAAYGERLLPQAPCSSLPTATAMLRLAPALLAGDCRARSEALPRYIRENWHKPLPSAKPRRASRPLQAPPHHERKHRPSTVATVAESAGSL